MGVLKGKEDRALFVNFITDVSPACDCPPFNDAPIVRNIGVVASTDPVAIDQASVDLVNRERALPDSCLKKNRLPGKDKFKGLYPDIDWPIQLAGFRSLVPGNRHRNCYPYVRLHNHIITLDFFFPQCHKTVGRRLNIVLNRFAFDFKQEKNRSRYVTGIEGFEVGHAF